MPTQDMAANAHNQRIFFCEGNDTVRTNALLRIYSKFLQGVLSNIIIQVIIITYMLPSSFLRI